MKKEELLKEFKKRLSSFHRKEKEEIIEKYRKQIDQKISEGMTEQEAVEDFGDLDCLVQELVRTYRTNEKVSSEFPKKRKLIDEIIRSIQTLGNYIRCKKIEDLLNIIGRWILVFMILWMMRIPVWILEKTGESIFRSFPSILDKTFCFGWMMLWEFLYIVMSVLVIYACVKTRFREQPENSRKVSFQNAEDSSIVGISQKFSWTCFLKLLWKVFVTVVTFPIVIVWIFLIVLLGILVAFSLKGVYLWGLFWMVLGLIFIFGSFVTAIYRLVLGGNRK